MSSNPCDTCAFREGSETHDNEPYNRIRGRIAALSGVPFFCHHGINHRVRTGIFHGQIFDVDGNIEKLKVCAGWKAEVRQHITPTTARRLFRRELGRDTLQHLQAAVAEKDPDEKKELWDEVRRLFRLLMKETGMNKNPVKTRLKPDLNRSRQ